MASMFSKNCVLSSYIDYFCLVCSEQFSKEEDTLSHILDPQHKDNLDACGYLPKYKDDLIRKVKGLYYCQRCDLTFPTATKVELHVEEVGHITKSKFKEHVKRVKDDIVALEKYVISQEAWNGFIENMCVICSTEFDDGDSHKASRSHVMSLIKTDLQYDEAWTTVYRKIDAKSYQCLTCNCVFGNDPNSHFGTENHKQAYKLYDKTSITSENEQKTYKMNEVNAETVNKNSAIDAGSDYSKKKMELKRLSERADMYRKNKINISLMYETAVCKKCSQNIDFNSGAIEKHIEEHKRTSYKTQETYSPTNSSVKNNGTDGKSLYTKPVSLTGRKKASSYVTTPRMGIKEFARHHELSHNRADNSFYCKICCRRIPAERKELEKHIDSKSHKDNMETKNNIQLIETKAPVKEPLFQTIKSYEVVHASKEIIVIIDNKHWLNAFGFYLIVRFNFKAVCQACHIDLAEDNILEHIITDTHIDAVTRCLWVTSMETEFIREIKLEEYHCGYCNQLEYSWEDMLEHIELDEHKMEKSNAQESLRNHSPNDSQCINSRQMQEFLKVFKRVARH